jgi:hypothetical protein
VSTALANPAHGNESLAERSARLPFEPAGSTLEDFILGAWEDLALHRRAECPVCGSELVPSGCRSCGAELS